MNDGPVRTREGTNAEYLLLAEHQPYSFVSSHKILSSRRFVTTAPGNQYKEETQAEVKYLPTRGQHCWEHLCSFATDTVNPVSSMRKQVLRLTRLKNKFVGGGQVPPNPPTSLP